MPSGSRGTGPTSGCGHVPLTERLALSQIISLPSMLPVADRGSTLDSATASTESWCPTQHKPFKDSSGVACEMTAEPPSLTCEGPQDTACLYVAYPSGLVLTPSDGDGTVSTGCKAGQACTRIAASQQGSRNCRPSRQRLSSAELACFASHLYRLSQSWWRPTQRCT